VSKKERVAYWLSSADFDWKVCRHLLEKRDYSYALFFAHLTVEKTLKALVAARSDQSPPMTHRLLRLAELAGLDLDAARMELLEAVTDFNLEARYPDESFSFRKKCTPKFTKAYIVKIRGLRTWLRRQLGR
jgi:HEPN domain-containing protein